MHTTLIAVGRLRRSLRPPCDDYLRRVNRYGPIVERELREGPPARPAAERRAIEGERVLAAVPDRATLVALDASGTAWTSEQLAAQLDRWRLAARPVALAIGGATGHDSAVLKRADQLWSLGPLTLAHELARLVVLEQWYRAWTILRGEPYHK